VKLRSVNFFIKRILDWIGYMQDRNGYLPETSSPLSSHDAADNVTSHTFSLLQLYLRQRTKPPCQPRVW